MPSAADISITETLALLDGTLREFADGVCDDRYAVWLGAGISLGKLPGLKGVAQAAIEHLRSKMDPADPQCPYRDSLSRILDLLVLPPGQRAAIDYATDTDTWPVIGDACQQLVNQYGVMLDQFPATEPQDYLVWTGIDVVGRYANPMTTPGPEHLGLAALIMEGVASDSASANWDNLIEKAMAILEGPNAAVLQVRVLPADVQNNVRRARLYKFHGCATLAGQNEATYRERIVGRASQIHGWADKAENLVIAGKLLDLAISKPTLMLGLSAQDTNIQSVFVKAHAQLPANFPTHPPAVVVSEDQVGTHQRSLLQNFYRDDYPTQSAAINTASLVRAYAGSLLPALWLHVLCAKLRALVDKAAPNLPAGEQDQLRDGLKRLRDLSASAATPAQHETFMLGALKAVGRAVRLFHRGRAPDGNEGRYAPLTAMGLAQSLADPRLDSDGLVELALALALIGCGEIAGHWDCGAPDVSDVKSGVVTLTGGGGATGVFFAASAHSAAQMFVQGHVAEDDDAVVVHSFEVPDRAARHPTGAPGRTGKLGLREIGVSSLADGAVSLDTLLKRFKAEMAL